MRATPIFGERNGATLLVARLMPAVWRTSSPLMWAIDRGHNEIFKVTPRVRIDEFASQTTLDRRFCLKTAPTWRLATSTDKLAMPRSALCVSSSYR